MKVVYTCANRGMWLNDLLLFLFFIQLWPWFAVFANWFCFWPTTALKKCWEVTVIRGKVTMTITIIVGIMQKKNDCCSWRRLGRDWVADVNLRNKSWHQGCLLPASLKNFRRSISLMIENIDKHLTYLCDSIQDRMRTGPPCFERFFDVATLLSFPTASHHGLPITQDLPSLGYRLLRLLIPDPQGQSRNKYRGGLTQPLHTPRSSNSN